MSKGALKMQVLMTRNILSMCCDEEKELLKNAYKIYYNIHGFKNLDFDIEYLSANYTEIDNIIHSFLSLN
jgi:hypothetical protein